MKSKLLFRINTLGGGGAEKVLINVLKCLNYDQYDVDVLINKKGGIYDAQVSPQVHFNYLFLSSHLLSKNIVTKLCYKAYRELGLAIFTKFP